MCVCSNAVPAAQVRSAATHRLEERGNVEGRGLCGRVHAEDQPSDGRIGAELHVGDHCLRLRRLRRRHPERLVQRKD